MKKILNQMNKRFKIAKFDNYFGNVKMVLLFIYIMVSNSCPFHCC